MDDQGMRGLMMAVVLVFCFAFMGLTIVSLTSASASFGSILSFGLAFLIIFLMLVGIVGAIRNPPDE